MRPVGERRIKRLTPGMRTLLYVAAALVFLAGVQLYLFPLRTERYFSWTIEPPLTAVFLGASYWSSVAFEAVAARQRTWAQARIAVPTVFVFTVLTLVVTLVHIDLFHLGSEFETATQAVTWIWIAVYSVVPVLMVLLVVAQYRAPGADPPRQPPLPPVWITIVTMAQAVVLLVAGLTLLIMPEHVADVWPWEITPLTGRAIGAWLTSLAVAACHAVWEHDVARLRPAAAAYVVFATLQGIALVRHPDIEDWSSAAAIGYVVFLVSAFVVGVGMIAVDRRWRFAR